MGFHLGRLKKLCLFGIGNPSPSERLAVASLVSWFETYSPSALPVN
jgi:hypothetical protein